MDEAKCPNCGTVMNAGVCPVCPKTDTPMGGAPVEGTPAPETPAQ